MANWDWVELEGGSARRAAYDDPSEELRLEFRSGGIYAYAGVPSSVFAWLQRVPDKAGFIRRMIVGVYPERRVDGRGTSTPPVAGDLERALQASLERLSSKP